MEALPITVRNAAFEALDAAQQASGGDIYEVIAAISLLVQQHHNYIAEGLPYDNFDGVTRRAAALLASGERPSFASAWAEVEKDARRRRRERDEKKEANLKAAAAISDALERERNERRHERVAMAAALEAERNARKKAEATAATLSAPPPPPPDAPPPPPPAPPPPPPSGGGPTTSVGTVVPEPSAPTLPPSLANIVMPQAPLWYDCELAEGLSHEWSRPCDFSVIWEEGPQYLHDLKTPPFTSENLCQRLAGLRPLQFAQYCNLRGVWMESLAALFVWYIKNGRAVQASHSMLAKVLAASLQKHSAFSAERPRIVRVETSASLTPEQRILRFIHLGDKIMIPRNRASMLLVLQSFNWKDGQSAFRLFQDMDLARVEHNEPIKTLFQQYLSNVHQVVSQEQSRGVKPEEPSPRWLLAVQILTLVEAKLSLPDPDEAALDDVRLALEQDRRDAQTPLPPVPSPAGRGRGREAGVNLADTDFNERLTSLEIAQALTAGARGRHTHKGVPGCADVPYIASTGKIWPKDPAPFEFNPARADGRCTHGICFACPRHNPPITQTFEYDEMQKLNNGNAPTRTAKGTPNERLIQRHETLSHVCGKCFVVWDDIWKFAHENPDDPDVPRFTKPLSSREFQDRLNAHKRTFNENNK